MSETTCTSALLACLRTLGIGASVVADAGRVREGGVERDVAFTRIEENLGAADLTLTLDDLELLDQAAAAIAVVGERDHPHMQKIIVLGDRER